MNLHRIPNSLVMAVIIAFYVTAIVAGWSWELLRAHTIAGVIALFIMMVASGVAGIGMGASKLSAAIVLWMGPDWGAPTLILAFLSLGVVGLLMQKIGGRAREDMPFMPFAGLSVAVIAGRHLWLPLLGG